MLLILIVPFVVSAVAFIYFKTITWKEFLLQLGVVLLVLGLAFLLARCSQHRDTEYLNGHITEKQHGWESCCHCSQVCVARNEDGMCTARIKECDHNRDYWWSLDSTVGSISVKDCSGSSSTPSIWKDAYVGEPVSLPHSYKNYLLADKDSIIVKELDHKYKEKIPNFPGTYDLYKRNHVVSKDVDIPPTWQKKFRQINDKLGKKKQVDVNVVLTKETNPEYAKAVESKWLYGPKNSFNVVLGVKEDKVLWARAVTLSKVSQLKIAIRDDLQGKSLEEVPTIIHDLVETKFIRTPMSTYEYLDKSTELPLAAEIILFILGIILSVGFTVAMHKHDIFGDENAY